MNKLIGIIISVILLHGSVLAQNRELNESFSVMYYYDCDPRLKNASRYDEPVVINVTPGRVSVSTLLPYYGSFPVKLSFKYYADDNTEWWYYEFEETASNSTYTAIAFSTKGCVLFSTSRQDYLCNPD
jgi:hypothetical protein